MLPGVYQATDKNGRLYYRASVTYRNKHISLGSFPSEETAHQAYQTASALTGGALCSLSVSSYQKGQYPLSFDKWVALINLRDNGIYIKNPIYLKRRYFIYYYNEETQLKFDADDLFYYSNHKIMKRGGHLFVTDYGMQVSLLSRYGIKSHAVCGRDYRFVNGDTTDFRYGNIELINRYYGVTRQLLHGKTIYTAKIHVIGDIIIGRYETEQEAAAAYNKSADLLTARGVDKKYPRNYIDGISMEAYQALYEKVPLSKRIRHFPEK